VRSAEARHTDMHRDMRSRVDPHQPISGASESRVDCSCEAIVDCYPGKPGILDLKHRDIPCVFLAGLAPRVADARAAADGGHTGREPPMPSPIQQGPKSRAAPPTRATRRLAGAPSSTAPSPRLADCSAPSTGAATSARCATTTAARFLAALTRSCRPSERRCSSSPSKWPPFRRGWGAPNLAAAVEAAAWLFEEGTARGQMTNYVLLTGQDDGCVSTKCGPESDGPCTCTSDTHAAVRARLESLESSLDGPPVTVMVLTFGDVDDAVVRELTCSGQTATQLPTGKLCSISSFFGPGIQEKAGSGGLEVHFGRQQRPFDCFGGSLERAEQQASFQAT